MLEHKKKWKHSLPSKSDSQERKKKFQGSKQHSNDISASLCHSDYISDTRMKGRTMKRTSDQQISNIKSSWSKDILDTQTEIRKMIETVQNTSLSLSDSSCDDTEQDENNEPHKDYKNMSTKSQTSKNKKDVSILSKNNQTTQTYDIKDVSTATSQDNTGAIYSDVDVCSKISSNHNQNKSKTLETRKQKTLTSTDIQNASAFRHLEAKTAELLYEKIICLREKGDNCLRELYQLRSGISHTMKVLQNDFDEVSYVCFIDCCFFMWCS